MDNNFPIITRFAPSPTGHLHIGGARTALFSWAFAKDQKDTTNSFGRFILRIEDTDVARSSEDSARGILEDLAWLGIDWNDGPQLMYANRNIGGDTRNVGPFFQAQRTNIYNQYLLQLIEQEKAYPAFETSEELEVKRQDAISCKQTYRYDRSALSIPLKDRLRRMKTGEPHVVRFRAPDEPIVVHDRVLGEIRYAAGEMDDFVIRKADGLPTYHFAVVIDDETMGVTHILRAQEHLNNTPRHVALQKSLGFRTPVYAHMPLIFNMDGSKMSKRDKDKSIRNAVKNKSIKAVPDELTSALSGKGISFSGEQFNKWLNDTSCQLPANVIQVFAEYFQVAVPEIDVNDFRKSGYLPEAIINFIALLGWSTGLKDDQGKDVEKFDMAFLAKNFSLERIGKVNARFDRAKLAAFNHDYLKNLSDNEYASRWHFWAKNDSDSKFASRLLSFSMSKLALLASVMKPRAKTFTEAMNASRFAFIDDDALFPR